MPRGFRLREFAGGVTVESGESIEVKHSGDMLVSLWWSCYLRAALLSERRTRASFAAFASLFALAALPMEDAQ